MRWILVDQFTHIEKGKYARGVRALTRSEPAVVDTYPCYPVMPGTLLLEMMAQVGGILVGSTIEFAKEVVLAKITDAEFAAPVSPPALLVIEARMGDLGDDAGMAECHITVDGKRVASANIFFGLFAYLAEEGKKSIVFSKDFMDSFAIRQTLAQSEAGATTSGAAR
jgi:3-hydroxyacyl-[acyl-carrier-protein] dehydratase